MNLLESKLRCTACGYEAAELGWMEVWDHREGGFVASCCPSCRSLGTTIYTDTSCFSQQRQIYGSERAAYTEGLAAARAFLWFASEEWEGDVPGIPNEVWEREGLDKPTALRAWARLLLENRRSQLPPELAYTPGSVLGYLLTASLLQQRNMPALEPCPYCGCEMHVDRGAFTPGYVPAGDHAEDCWLRHGDSARYTSAHALAEAWNHRGDKGDKE